MKTERANMKDIQEKLTIKERAFLLKDKAATKAKAETKGFTTFLGKYSIISMALGIIIGSTTKDVVNTLVDGIISPLLSLVLAKILPENNLVDWIINIEGTEILIGQFINTFIEMLLILLIIYIVIGVLFRQKDMIGVEEGKEKKEEIKDKK